MPGRTVNNTYMSNQACAKVGVSAPSQMTTEHGERLALAQESLLESAGSSLDFRSAGSEKYSLELCSGAESCCFEELGRSLSW